MTPRHYWNFYWPLALTSLLTQIEGMYQNRILAASGAGARELSAFANAHGAYMMVGAFIAFMPQLVTVYGADPAARRVCFRFVMLCGLALTLPLGVMAYSDLGGAWISHVLGVPDSLLPRVRDYLVWLAPLVLFVTFQQYITGRMVQSGRTKAIIRYNAIHIAVLIAMLEGLSRTALDVRWVVAAAAVSANIVHCVLAGLYCRRLGDSADRKAAAPGGGSAAAAASLPDFRGLWGFFWPMAMTSLMFALSRPIIYHFVNRLPLAEALTTVAALRVAFDSGMFFQAPVNQFRHVYAQFGGADPRGVRRFMLATTGVYAGIMALFAGTPLGDLLFVDFLNLPVDMLAPARQCFMVMCLGPVAIGVRNIFHGELIINRRTHGMAKGGVWRIGVVFAFSWLLFRMGRLNHVTGAAVMVAGFGFEALGAYTAMRKLLRRIPRETMDKEPGEPA